MRVENSSSVNGPYVIFATYFLYNHVFNNLMALVVTCGHLSHLLSTRNIFIYILAVISTPPRQQQKNRNKSEDLKRKCLCF